MEEVERKGIEKAKLGLVVCSVIVVILAISNLWLYTRIDSLQDQMGTLQTDNNRLRSEIDSLNSEFDNYVATHHYTDDEYDEALLSYYYVEREQKFGVYGLEDELIGLEWIEPYEEGVFDCSEMSAYLEWYLEKQGWHAIIIVGDSPFDSDYHAWLLVETSPDHYTPVESTTIQIVWWDDPYFDSYFIYDYEFETIQEATAYNESEFDWWK